MSKSKYNVVNPDDMCAQYGADALRLYELFMGPLEDGTEWETAGVAGTRRFLDRVWRLVVETDVDGVDTGRPNPRLTDATDGDRDLERALHAAIKKVSEGVTELRFNTAISEMMMFVNAATSAPSLPKAWIDAFVRIVSPFAPHLGEELWRRLGHEDTIAFAPWPAFDEAKLAVDTIELAVQISGKTRGSIRVPAGIDQAGAIAAVKADDGIKKFLDGKTIRREIYVPGRLVNLVVA
jgi:leucyl-tRNA synthetase